MKDHDHVLEYMSKHDLPMTRDCYLALAWFGTPPRHLSAEQEYDLPNEFRRQKYREQILSARQSKRGKRRAELSF